MSAFDGYTGDVVRAIIKIADAADLAAKAYAKSVEKPTIVMNVNQNSDGTMLATEVKNHLSRLLNATVQGRQ